MTKDLYNQINSLTENNYSKAVKNYDKERNYNKMMKNIGTQISL